MTERQYVWRVLVVTLGVLCAWVGLGARLAFLHLGPNDHLRDKVETHRRWEQEIHGPRGRILDRDGNILAIDLLRKNVIANPERIKANGQVDRVGTYLAHLLELPPAMVMGRLQKQGRYYECIRRVVDEETSERIARMNLKGVDLEDAWARNYPLESLMCHVLGFANMQGMGSAGVEQEQEKYLRGHPGVRVGQRDAAGHEVYRERELDIEPRAGADVYLTIDERLQYLVEKELDRVMNDPSGERTAKSCWAIVQRVRTGEILAMASRPAYDLNHYRQTPPELLRNHAIGVVYEPGSTMKGPVIAAALNEGVVSPQDILFCENGAWSYAGRLLRDHHGHGNLSVADILKKSSNIGAAKIALKLGPRRLDRKLREFGFGELTGIDLPGEERGIFHPVAQWSKISISRIPMGQGVACTAMQLLNAYCCIANDGFLMKPYVVDRVVDVDGVTLVDNEPEVLRRPIRPETARMMQTLLGRVTEDGGTARRARVEGYSVAGKTGTAQKPVAGGYSQTDYVASFVGFLPAEQPELGLIVVVDEPQPIHVGGAVAAPVFREIAEQAVRYLDIPPYDPQHGLLLGRAD